MKELIKKLIDDTVSEIDSVRNDGLAIAIFSDRIDVYQLPLSEEDKNEINVDKLLECRVFDSEIEIKISRGSVFSPWKYRVFDYSLIDKRDLWREWQFLDIDSKIIKNEEESKYINIRTTGGGKYRLPKTTEIVDAYDEFKNGTTFDFNLKACFEYQMDYYAKTGQAYVKDWRLVSIGKGGK